MTRVEDRWLKPDRKTRSAEYGKGMRWRAVWDDPEGKEKKKSFANRDAANAYMAGQLTDV